jgi:hypothetical protein
MTRLLFAAARGARIQWYSKPHTQWCASAVVSFDKRAPQRIHPEDEALQYGPVSTTLREFAATGKTQYTLTAMLAMAAYNHEKEYPFILASEWPHASLFALILAEALADEGL